MTPNILISFVVAGLGTYEQKENAHTHKQVSISISAYSQ